MAPWHSGRGPGSRDQWRPDEFSRMNWSQGEPPERNQGARKRDRVPLIVAPPWRAGSQEEEASGSHLAPWLRSGGSPIGSQIGRIEPGTSGLLGEPEHGPSRRPALMSGATMRCIGSGSGSSHAGRLLLLPSLRPQQSCVRSTILDNNRSL